jgi:uncharacterized protein DUF6519
MQGDFDRISFDPAQRFANVLLQQGRLLLPSEFNAQGAMHHYFLRALVVDLVGRAWRAGDGFAISVDSNARLRLSIGKGHYYVDGILCENAETCAYEEQPYSPTGEEVSALDGSEAAVYLDCWERHVTWLNEPALREPALGGPDTTTRVQIAWQARVLSKASVAAQLGGVKDAYTARAKAETDAARKAALNARADAIGTLVDNFVNVTCDQLAAVLAALDEARPQLAADARRDDEHPDPCAIAADAEYRGRENQLYRVEIHRPGLAGEATFKWSRENGSVAFRVLDVEVDEDGDTPLTRVTLESLGHDRRTGLCAGDWIELSDDDSEFGWVPVPLLRVEAIDPARRAITLDGALTPLVDPAKHAIARRWDHAGDPDAGGALLVAESKDDSGWIELERGVRIRFAPGGWYRKGDYWIVPARVVTGDVDWPMAGKVRRALEPFGIAHHRAALGLVSKGASGKWAAGDQCGCRRNPLCA